MNGMLQRFLLEAHQIVLGQQTVFCKWCFDCKRIQAVYNLESVKSWMLHLPVNGQTSSLKPGVMGDLEGPFYSPEMWNDCWTLPIFPVDKIILVYSAQCKFWWTDGMSVHVQTHFCCCAIQPNRSRNLLQPSPGSILCLSGGSTTPRAPSALLDELASPMTLAHRPHDMNAWKIITEITDEYTALFFYSLNTI